MTKPEKSVSKTKRPDHLWKPGTSGNPSGRPPGTSATQKLRAAISDCVPEVIDKMKEQARGGDVAAARLLLERVLPPIKAVDETQQIEIPDGADLTTKGHAILKAASDGVIPVSQAAALMSAVGALARVVEIDELARRVAALEAGAGKADVS